MDMTAERISLGCSLRETHISKARRSEMCKLNESRSFSAGSASSLFPSRRPYEGEASPEGMSPEGAAPMAGFPLRSCVMTKDESLSCCINDEGWPLGFGNQILKSNHPMRHLLRVIVVSDREKAERICQVSSEEMNANESLMRCRYG